MQFQISSRRENFTLSDVEENTSRPLNRGGIADLPFLRTLLAILQKSQEPSFWEVMDSIVLLAHASLAASRTLLQWLLDCLNFTLESEDFSLWYKRKKWFLWTMAAAQQACQWMACGCTRIHPHMPVSI